MEVTSGVACAEFCYITTQPGQVLEFFATKQNELQHVRVVRGSIGQIADVAQLTRFPTWIC